ncbi:MAG: ABC transporter permease [Bacteroidales bacterium]|nr:ABC transporter permease [Bacteroidales bacterium]MBN2758365.1 ABC transporter permease [Bacteroidales bacterium]
MNTELFIAKRLFISKENKNAISNSVIKIAIIGIALGMIIMILSIAIVTGFKQEVRRKVVGFGSHIIITNYDSNLSYETAPIKKNQSFYPDIESVEGIKHIQTFAVKAGIIKTKEDIQGVVLKGIGYEYDWSFFKNNIIEGENFIVDKNLKTDKVLISKYIASLLKLKVGDPLFMYFVQKPVKSRRFEISGIYNTGIEEFDKTFIITDIAHVQKLNDWSNNQVSGFEIIIDDFDNLEKMTSEVFDIVGTIYDENEDQLKVKNIRENYQQIFDWLKLSDTNVWIILGLMLLVGGFNMISGLLVIILERTNMIGILKALGAKNFSIRKIFIYYASFLIGKGLFWGNLIGITLCLLQYYFHIFKLDPASYYIDNVPINLKITHLLLLNTGTLFITTLMLIIPSIIIAKISPVKAIKFT